MKCGRKKMPFKRWHALNSPHVLDPNSRIKFASDFSFFLSFKSNYLHACWYWYDDFWMNQSGFTCTRTQKNSDFTFPLNGIFFSPHFMCICLRCGMCVCACVSVCAVFLCDLSIPPRICVHKPLLQKKKNDISVKHLQKYMNDFGTYRSFFYSRKKNTNRSFFFFH